MTITQRKKSKKRKNKTRQRSLKTIKKRTIAQQREISCQNLLSTKEQVSNLTIC